MYKSKYTIVMSAVYTLILCFSRFFGGFWRGKDIRAEPLSKFCPDAVSKESALRRGVMRPANSRD